MKRLLLIVFLMVLIVGLISADSVEGIPYSIELFVEKDDFTGNIYKCSTLEYSDPDWAVKQIRFGCTKEISGKWIGSFGVRLAGEYTFKPAIWVKYSNGVIIKYGESFYIDCKERFIGGFPCSTQLIVCIQSYKEIMASKGNVQLRVKYRCFGMDLITDFVIPEKFIVEIKKLVRWCEE